MLQEFISQVLNAFLIITEETSNATLEGEERQFRHALAKYLFGDVLGWEGHYVVGEILDLTCLDDENFPIIVIETKGSGVDLTDEIKEKLRSHIEDLGSVKYGVFANPSKFVIYRYEDSKLMEIANVNVASAVFLAREKLEPSADEKKDILKIEMLKRERLV